MDFIYDRVYVCDNCKVVNMRNMQQTESSTSSTDINDSIQVKCLDNNKTYVVNPSEPDHYMLH